LKERGIEKLLQPSQTFCSSLEKVSLANAQAIAASTVEMVEAVTFIQLPNR